MMRGVCQMFATAMRISAMAGRFSVPVMTLLCCCILSAQPVEDPQAQYKRGTDYWYGNGVPQDYVEAANWFRKAAEQGHAEAQYRLAQMLAIGQGIRQDDTEAANWYRKAAEQGVALAQYNLGTMYVFGRGVARDYAEAVKWFRKAADQGVRGSAIQLGCILSRRAGCRSGLPRGADVVRARRQIRDTPRRSSRWA